ncbi:MAG: hypothetical protein U9P80_09170 [Thermodesulfobacteriota bacterium]|nr:hypothetical protein [Thermodesulfobacteriota bacterium]
MKTKVIITEISIFSGFVFFGIIAVPLALHWVLDRHAIKDIPLMYREFFRDIREYDPVVWFVVLLPWICFIVLRKVLGARLCC